MFIQLIFGTVGVSVYSISPITGSVLGGTNVTVFGVNFQNVSSLVCLFGSVSVPAKFVSFSTHFFAVVT